ncbi:MAG: cysteine desulfurase family protein [Bacillota bacterium]|jgi:cysteine desulfurase
MIYLDNAATTRPRPEVVEAVCRALEGICGNPSSLHRLGAEASRALEEARRSVAMALGVPAQDLIFTSGGTEGNNMAIRGAALASRGRHLITTEVEHPSVYQVFQELGEEGWRVDYIGVDRRGVVDPAEVARALRDDTVLVSVMLVNNEVGSVQPIREIRRAIGPKPILHVDAVQALGKVPAAVSSLGADLATVSSHKIHGPKGAGALYKAPRVRLKPLSVGGQQERALRPGTENVPAIVGFGVAAALAHKEIPESSARMHDLRARLAGLLARIPGARMNGHLEVGAPHILSYSFLGVPGETLLHHLEAMGVIVSTRSACSSRHKTPNRVLNALGCSHEEAEAAIRLGLSSFTTEEEIDHAACAVRESVEAIRGLGGS